MDAYSKFQSVVVLVTALLGVVVTFWPPDTFKVKAGLVFIFAVLSLTALFLQQQKEKGDESKAATAQRELLNWQRGELENPPRVGVLVNKNSQSGSSIVQFFLENPSEFPAYEISIRIWDLENVPKTPLSLEDIYRTDILNGNIQSLAGHVVQVFDPRVEIPQNVTSKWFAVQYTCRTGGYSQKIRVENVNGECIVARQVRQFGSSENILFEQVPTEFPRGNNGEVDWSMKPNPSQLN